MAGVKLLIYCSIAMFLGTIVSGVRSTLRPKDSHFIHLKSVTCQHNPKFLVNVTCFAKSYSRQISKATVLATIKGVVTSVIVDFKLQYKYGTIYRDVLHSPNKLDFCYWMRNIETLKERPMAHQVYKIFNDSVPGFLRPCPWKEIRLHNMTVETGNLMSVWPSGDYKLFVYSFIGNGEDFMNVTFVGSFYTPLKESFG